MARAGSQARWTKRRADLRITATIAAGTHRGDGQLPLWCVGADPLLHPRVQDVRPRAYDDGSAMDPSALLESPLTTAEFLAVDTETNGLGGERCELTEVGAVLIGGGELHERWSSPVRMSAPLSRGIQRFTGISQAMAEAAPAPEVVLPHFARLVQGRVLLAHSARFDQNVLRPAVARAALPGRDPPVLCTIALARRFAPLQRRRGLASLADALGIDVEDTHRALPDAVTCARVFCALFARLCANAATVGEALQALRPRRARMRPKGAKRPRKERPGLTSLPTDAGVYVFRDADGRPLYVGKSVCVRTRARSHFTTPATWTGQAAHVDYEATESELGALVLETRLIKALRPSGNVRGKRTADGYAYLRCRLDIAFPILEVAREPAAGHSVTVGPVQGIRALSELVEQLNSLFGLRHCGRALNRRPWPSAYGQMGRCLSPCLGDLDPNLYRERLDAALELFVAEPDGGAALLTHIETQMRQAAAAQAYERAAWLRRRHDRLASLLGRLGGVLRAIHAGTRLVLAPHPTAADRFDAFWIAGGRVRDWGALPTDPGEPAQRSPGALASAPRRELGGWLPAEEIDEARIVGAWTAAHTPPALELAEPPSAERLGRFVASAAGEISHMEGAAEVGPQGVEWRRPLHRPPEPSFEERATAAFVAETLGSFAGLEIERPTENSVIARLFTGRPGPTVALRADIDALPITEESGVDFASENAGAMHACGHDGHTAMLLGAARTLSENAGELPGGELRFIFQHAEELAPGGARELVAAGVLDGVDLIYGCHLWTPLELGKVAVRPGPFMAASDFFRLTISGRGGHAGRPHDAVD